MTFLQILERDVLYYTNGVEWEVLLVLLCKQCASTLCQENCIRIAVWDLLFQTRFAGKVGQYETGLGYQARTVCNVRFLLRCLENYFWVCGEKSCKKEASWHPWLATGAHCCFCYEETKVKDISVKESAV